MSDTSPVSPVRSRKPQLNHSTNKVLSILEYLCNAGEPVRLQTLAVDLGINTSTASRFLMSLEKNGYIQQEKETRRYMLTMKICSLSYKLLSNNIMVVYAKPFLKRLSALFMEVTCLSIEQDMSVVYVATHDGPDNMLKSFNFIGKRAPMHCTGSGKLLLSNYSDEQLIEYLRAKGHIKPTENTINTYRELKKELKQIREQNYAIDNEECEIGMRCVAIPVRTYTGEIVAGLSVTGPSARMPFKKIEENLPQLFLISKQLSILLGCDDRGETNHSSKKA
jgi:DNA-binding IclR family transcriptional regulator